MKKTFKRAGVAVLSMAMLLSMGAVTAVTANAANVTVTLSTTSTALADKNCSYSYWKVADAQNTADATFNGLFDGQGAAGVTIGGTNYTSIAAIAAKEASASPFSAEQKKQLADKIEKYISTNSIASDGSGSTSNNTATLSVDPGWYFIKTATTDSDVFAEPILVYVTENTNVSVKTETINVQKTINSVTRADASTANANHTEETAYVGVGDKVQFKVVTNFPDYSSEAVSGGSVTEDFVINDIPSAGLDADLTPANVQVKVDGTVINSGYTIGEATAQKDTDGTTDVAASAPTNGISITFTDATVLANLKKSVEVTYYATVLNTAVMGATGNNNTAYLNYGHDYYTTGDKKIKKDGADVYTAKVTLVKEDSTDNTKKLQGVVFTLKDNTTNLYVAADGTESASATNFTTNVNGEIEFNRLPAGSFTLHEVSTIDHYKALDHDITFTVTAGTTSNEYNGTITLSESDDNASVDGATITVTNPPASALPGTGGMGTTLFTVGGAAVVLLAGFLFVVYMRKRKVEE